MAITLDVDKGFIFDVLKAFDVPLSEVPEEAKLKATSHAGGTLVIEVTLGTSKLSLDLPMKTVNMAMKGFVGPASKANITAQLKAMLKKLKDEAAKNPSQAPMLAVKKDPLGKSMVLKVDAMGKVPLIKAEAIGQEVLGTSSDSTYYLAAMYKDFKLAVRRSKFALSIRLEGTGLKSHAGVAKALGFSVKDGYASVHFKVNSNELAEKTFGAVIFALGYSDLICPVSVEKITWPN